MAQTAAGVRDSSRMAQEVMPGCPKPRSGPSQSCGLLSMPLFPCHLLDFRITSLFV